jgi:hypothetical protein
MKRITLITLVVAAAVMPTFAQAKPVESEYRLGPGEIPYRIQDTVHNQVMGLGVSEGQYKALGLSDDGVAGKSPDDRPFARSTSVEPAPVVITKDAGWSIDLGNPAFAGIALLLGLLAGGMGVAFYNHRRTKLSPA